jgi:hypothetical protein
VEGDRQVIRETQLDEFHPLFHSVQAVDQNSPTPAPSTPQMTQNSSAHIPPLKVSDQTEQVVSLKTVDSVSYFNFTKSKTKIAHTPIVTGN